MVHRKFPVVTQIHPFHETRTFRSDKALDRVPSETGGGGAGQKVSPPPVVTRRAMNFSKRFVVFRIDSRPELSVDAFTLPSNGKLGQIHRQNSRACQFH